MDQLERTETFETIAKDDIFMAEETLSGSTKRAVKAAEKWLNQIPEVQQE